MSLMAKQTIWGGDPGALGGLSDVQSGAGATASGTVPAVQHEAGEEGVTPGASVNSKFE